MARLGGDASPYQGQVHGKDPKLPTGVANGKKNVLQDKASRCYRLHVDFEFDPAKTRANLEKHGTDFETAKFLWTGKPVEVPALTADEPRWLVIGKVGEKHWTAVITRREAGTRIISVRRSREKERKVYEESGDQGD